MLSRSELVTLAKTRGLSPWQEEKRYVQALALYSLRDQPLILKGGTYLWFFHGLDRFSDDLDFTEEQKIVEDLQSIIASTAKLFGLSCECKSIKNDSYILSFRADAKGPLYNSSTDLCRVYIEVSKRDKVEKRALSAKLDEPLYGLPITFLKGMDLSEVAAEKVRELIRRKKARDMYDLWYLLKRLAVHFDIELVNDKLSFYKTKFEIDSFDSVLKETKRNWTRDIRPIVLGESPTHDDTRVDILNFLKYSM